MAGKQNIAKIKQWQIANVDRIEIKPNKSLKIPQRIDMAIRAGYKGKRQTYIVDAILDKLDRDKVPHIEDE